jgi:hypothetical protein
LKIALKSSSVTVTLTFAPDSNKSLKLIIEIFRLNLDSFVPSNRNRGK